MLREEELAGAILVVLANKQDMEGCMSVAEVHQALGLDALKNRTFQVKIFNSLIVLRNKPKSHFKIYRFSKPVQQKVKD